MDADEIADAMVKALNSEEFAIYRTASSISSHEDRIKSVVLSKDKSACKDVYDRYFNKGANSADLGNELVLKYGENQALEVRESLETSLKNLCKEGMESLADDEKEEDDEDKKCEGDCECQSCEDMNKPVQNARDVVACDFAMAQLVKIADAVDNGGFEEVAGVIDEAIKKLAEKKKGKKKMKTDETAEKKPKSPPKDFKEGVMEMIKSMRPELTKSQAEKIVKEFWKEDLSLSQRKKYLKQYE